MSPLIQESKRFDSRLTAVQTEFLLQCWEQKLGSIEVPGAYAWLCGRRDKAVSLPSLYNTLLTPLVLMGYLSKLGKGWYKVNRLESVDVGIE